MAKPQTIRLTRRKLEAMASALASVMAGPIDGDDTPSKDFQDAAEWVAAQLAKRKNKGA